MEYINDFYENLYEYIYEIYGNTNNTFYNYYFQSEKPDIFLNINFNITNIYTIINILNDRKQIIDRYSIPNDFDVADKLSILKYKLSFCLKSKKDMSDDMIMHIENYKFNNQKIKNDIEKIINDVKLEIKNDIEMINLENKLKDDIEMVNLENRLIKLNEEIEENEDNDTGTGILIKQKNLV